MIRKPVVSSVCAAIALFVCAPVVFGQQHKVLPKQNAFLKPAKDPETGQSRALAAALNSGVLKVDKSSDAVHLPLFNYTVTSTRDGKTYSGTIVGDSPFDHPSGKTEIPSQIVPVIVITHSVFAGIDANGNVVTAPGTTVFNPSVRDDSCLSAPNDVPITLVQKSPIYTNADFNYGGTDVGVTQATDAFQRANFYDLLTHGNSDSDNSVSYHVILSPVHTVSAIVVSVPAGNGVAYPSAAFGGCPTGKVAIVDNNVYAPALFNAIPGGLDARGVNPSTFPMFVEHNVVECESLAAGENCGTLNAHSVCCILGFHIHNGQQTLATADFDTSDIFASPVPDVSDMSHEVGEWMNNPLNSNSTPAWGHIGQVPGCQGNLEVGDPLSGTLAPPIFNPQNGFTYHLQEMAFFSWFYGAPSVGIHGWFSNNDTFTHDAGPVCTNTP
ncbi:MAG TPA: hypothetical protein VFW25_03715 [Silvibacterium sp.]|nr:hypothetical protein [Silvibacterium sp.]